jgi:hypothetical protein
MAWFDPPSHPKLQPGVHHIAEIMPLVLDRYGLSLDQEHNSVRPATTEAIELFDVMMACLESAHLLFKCHDAID